MLEEEVNSSLISDIITQGHLSTGSGRGSAAKVTDNGLRKKIKKNKNIYIKSGEAWTCGTYVPIMWKRFQQPLGGG